MHNSLIVALGGFTTPTKKTRVLFCREVFDYAELEEHPYLCNHLGNIDHLIERFKFMFNNFFDHWKDGSQLSGHIPTLTAPLSKKQGSYKSAPIAATF